MFISHSLEAGKSRIKAPADSVSGDDPFPVHKYLSFHCVLIWWKEQGSSLQFFLNKGTNPIHESSTLMTKSLPNGLTSCYYHLGP